MMINYSIIIPHKNIPSLLERCLNSIPMRDDIQVIVVDDNSGSDIVDFSCFPGCDRKNVSLVFTKEGRGAGFARNVGLEHVKGKWVIFADADDFFTNDFSNVLDLYLNSPCDAILFPVRIVDSDSLEEAPLRDSFINNTIHDESFTLAEKFSRVITPHSKIISAAFIRKHQLRYEEIPYSNDSMFGTQLAVWAQSLQIDPSHSFYALTFREGSLTTIRNFEAFKCRLDASIRCNNYLRSHGHPEWMIQLFGIYLSWASRLNLKATLYAIWQLWKNGYLFYYDSHSWHNKYYNAAWYHILKALWGRKK